ncbi:MULTISPECIES: response regulator [Silvimonas]|uniref:Response regulatory domain-containing protein n=1 Tax=Silvimonas amylolytica TaxID=449663 RepID=A0ABQ2PN63_9NEIS|nr:MULTISPECIES: response regulator [Silvimonas]GGP27057.1 hypothetical protein GCM10010971_28760 [Silvimonas amylolytica]
MDDDEAVRVALSSFIRSSGWAVETFDSAAALLAFSARHEIALLIADIRMPGMSGIEMFDQLVKTGKQPPTLFVSSYCTPEHQRRVGQLKVLGLMQKPFSLSTLSELIVKTLGDPPAAA